MKDKCYYDIGLPALALAYMRKKKLPLTTGNLFWIMEKILKRVDKCNKNTSGKKIQFKNNITITDKVWLDKSV